MPGCWRGAMWFLVAPELVSELAGFSGKPARGEAGVASDDS